MLRFLLPVLAALLLWSPGAEVGAAELHVVETKHYPAAALTEVLAPDFDLGAIVSGREPASRAVTWAVYTYLATGKNGRPLSGFATFARKMDAGGKAALLFRRHDVRPGARELRSPLPGRGVEVRSGPSQWPSAGRPRRGLKAGGARGR